MRAFLLSLLCLCSTIGFSQHYLPPFEIGVQGGPGFSIVYGKGVEKQKKTGLDFKPSLSFAAGLTLQGNLKKFLGFRTGVMVERRGFYIPLTSSDVNGNAVKLNFVTQYHYVNIPMLLQFHTGSRTAFTLQAGGYVGALFRSRVFVQNRNDMNTVNPGGYYYFDGGVTLGMGLRVPVKKRVIFSLEVRNNLGLTRIIRNTENEDRMYNDNLTVMLGIAFATKRKG